MANLFSEKPIVKVVMLKGQDGEEKLINQADGSGLSFWIGTKAEYEAIPEQELISNCVYYITDDTRDDFNARLNQLDTAIDNNTTAIAENAAEIENLTDYKCFEAQKTLTGTNVFNTDKVVGTNYCWGYYFGCVKSGKTITISCPLMKVTTEKSFEFIDLATAFFGNNPTTEQRKKVSVVPNHYEHEEAVNPSELFFPLFNESKEIVGYANIEGSVLDIRLNDTAEDNAVISFSAYFQTEA